MIEDFKVIYKILTILVSSMDNGYFDEDIISPESLGISKNRRDNLLEMLYDSAYIKGILISYYTDGEFRVSNINNIKITLKGLEYLEENTIFKRIQRDLKGIREVLS